MIDFTFSSAIHFVTIISPFLLSFFLLLISIFNQNIKGFIYLAGVLLGSLVWKLFRSKAFGTNDVAALPSICSVVPNISSFPSYNSYFIAFTAVYVIMPMILTSQLNWGLISFFLILFVTDGYFHLAYKCTKNSWSPVVGALIGVLCAIIWFELFYQTGYKDLLYYNDFTSNKAVCTRPSKQTFKCKVYKNGVLVSNL